LGIPSLNIYYGGENEGGEYHSIYDSYDHYRRFKDPGFAYGVALAKTAGRIMIRISEAEILPFDYHSLQKTLSSYVTELINLVDQMRETTSVENQLIREGRYMQAADPLQTYLPPQIKDDVPYLNFSTLQNAVGALEKNCIALNETLGSTSLTPSQKNSLNKNLYTAEQQLLLENGLPKRAWYRHCIYAPGLYTGYGVKTLPGIREAIEQRNWKEAQEQIEKASAAINRFSSYLNDAGNSVKQ
jgi:N-acetylated-alpha-linked acidic dipeptidase